MRYAEMALSVMIAQVRSPAAGRLDVGGNIIIAAARSAKAQRHYARSATAARLTLAYRHDLFTTSKL